MEPKYIVECFYMDKSKWLKVADFDNGDEARAYVKERKDKYLLRILSSSRFL